MREIEGRARTVRELLAQRKYAIDYYQREYKWETKQVRELIEDLSDRFLRDFDPTHERDTVAGYGRYFLGSIILSHKDGTDYIVDGQQRLTTLTLLLIYLNNLQKGRGDAVRLDDLVYSEKFAKKSFNLNVEERVSAMEALFNEQPFDETEHPESVVNVIRRYRDIEDLFPEELMKDALPYFADWLTENVQLVEITAFSDDHAYTIFETMNDRGLSLAPADMLKGYLLANISDPQHRLRSNETWKVQMLRLQDLGKEEDADFLKAWLRSQYANSIRERKRGAVPQDFDRLGTEFHRWIREHDQAVGLARSSDFVELIERDLRFYARQYERLRRAGSELTPGLESVFFNAQLEFTLQYTVLLAPLRPDDSEDVVDRKIAITSDFIDIWMIRRLWNFRSIAYSTVQYTMFTIMRDIRGKAPDQLARLLIDRLNTQEERFSSNDRLYVHQQNKRAIHYILARITSYLEAQSAMPSRFSEYMGGKGLDRYEVEHIWANKPERFQDEFSHEADFQEYRNRIGGLLLLPKSFNASYGALPYEEKLEHYFGQNVLAQSLHPNCYERNPGFLAFVRRTGLPFHPHPHFKKSDLDERHALYRDIAELVWDTERLTEHIGALA